MEWNDLVPVQQQLDVTRKHNADIQKPNIVRVLQYPLKGIVVGGRCDRDIEASVIDDEDPHSPSIQRYPTQHGPQYI